MAPQLRLFGTPHAYFDGRREAILPIKPACLLLHLALRGEWVSREELTRLLRAGDEEPSSRGSLRLLLTRARRLPWAAGLEAEPSRVRWQVDSDVGQFRRALSKRNWREAAEAYPAPLLQGWPTPGLPGFQEWLDAERAALHETWLGAVYRHEETLVSRGAFDEAARLLGRALSFDFLGEETLQRFVRASYLAGRREDALRAYERFAARLRADLGLTPLAATLALLDTVRRAEPLREVPAGEVLAEAAAHKALPLSLARPPALIGRAAQLEALRGAAQPVALLAGEPGAGKTRLLSEAWPRASWIRCAEGLEHLPYFPILSAVRARLPELPDLGPYARDLARFVPEVLAGQGAQEGEAGESGKTRLFEAFARVFDPENVPSGNVLIVDDVQWADAGTLEWLLFAARRGLKVRGAFRPGEVGPAPRDALSALGADVRVIALGPLSEGEVALLVATVAPQAGEAGDLLPWLHRNSGGNPLFVLEWLRALLEEGVYELRGEVWHRAAPGHGEQGHGEQGHGTQGRDLGAVRIAPALADLVLRRARGLSREDRRVLDVASLLGGGLTPARLARVLEMPEWDVEGALARIEGRGLLRGESFAHDVVRRALYEALPDARRRLGHGKVARELEGDLSDLQVAEHAHAAGDQATAARLWFRVARFSFGVRRGFEDEASALYRRVLSLDARVPEWYRACAYLAVRERVAGRAQEARALVETVVRESDDGVARAMARAEGATLAYLDGDLSEAARLVALAADEAAPLNDPGLSRDVLLMQANIAHYQGHYEKALHIAENVVADLRREPLSMSACTWRSTLAANLCALGRFEEALAHYREQLEAARFLGLRAQQVTASSDIIATLHDLGRIHEGVVLAEAALELGQFGDTYPLRYHLALAYSREGRNSEAQGHLLAVIAGSPSVNMRAHAFALLAEVRVNLGEQAQARAALEDGLTLAENCDILTARAVVGIAALQFAPPDLLARARQLVATLREDELPAYLRGDFAAALAARGEADWTTLA